MEENKIVQERLDNLDRKVTALGNLVVDERKVLKTTLQEVINIRTELNELIKENNNKYLELTSKINKIEMTCDEIQGKYNQINPSSKKLTVSDETLYKLKYMQGKSWNLLSEMYGVSVSTLKRAVQRYQTEQLNKVYMEE